MGAKTNGLEIIKHDPYKETLESFKGRLEIAQIIDQFLPMVEELFLIRNPRFKFVREYRNDFDLFLKNYLNGKRPEEAGCWFYFSWNKTLIHYLTDGEHQELRTARNRNIITKEEQEKIYNFSVGIAGLSVGSHGALTLAMMGMGKIIKLADPDEISGSNLNRVRWDFSAVGKNKCELAAQTIRQINPYSDVQAYPDGITEDNFENFLAKPKIGILVEEMDNLEMKIRLRLEAKKRRIPVIMATDNGDNIIMDIERYDLEPDLPIFNGAAGNLTLEEFRKILPSEMPKLATKIAGPDYVVPRMRSSLLEVGRTLYSWPQLGDAATLSGVAIAYAVKRIALGEKIKSGKFEVNLDAIFDPDYFSKESAMAREESKNNFLKKIGLKD